MDEQDLLNKKKSKKAAAKGPSGGGGALCKGMRACALTWRAACGRPWNARGAQPARHFGERHGRWRRRPSSRQEAWERVIVVVVVVVLHCTCSG